MLPPKFLFAILVAVCGASLLYGYNTSVVSTPAANIQNWYAICYATRAGLWPIQISEGGSNSSNSTNSSYNDTATEESTVPQVVNVSLLWSITTSIYCLAGMIGAFCFGTISDKIGRKMTLLINNGLAILAAVCFLVCYPICSPELLIIGRFIVGLNCGVGLGLCPLYLSELATKSLRGPVTASSYLGCSVGLLLAQVFSLSTVLGSPNTWTYCLALTGIPAIVQLCLLPLCPESPRFLLITKHDPQAARKAFIWLYGEEVGEEEFTALKQEVMRRSVISLHKLASLASMKDVMSTKSMQKITSSLAVQARASGLDLTKLAAEANLDPELAAKASAPAAPNIARLAERRKKKSENRTRKTSSSMATTVPLKLFFTDRQYSLPLFIGIVCHIAQQWSGINAVFTYSSTIFKGIGLSASVAQYCTLATGGSSLISVMCCVPLFTRLGRRTLVLMAISVMCFGLLLLVISGATSQDAPVMNYIGIVAVIIFIFGYAPIGTTPPVLVSEMFLQNARGMAFSIAIAVRWGSNIVILFAFPYMMAAMQSYTFLVFLGIMLACLAGLALYLPETKGKPIMEIHDIVSHGFDHMQIHLDKLDVDNIAYHLHLPFHKTHEDGEEHHNHNNHHHHHPEMATTDGTQTDGAYDVVNSDAFGAGIANPVASINDLSGLELHKLNSQAEMNGAIDGNRANSAANLPAGGRRPSQTADKADKKRKHSQQAGRRKSAADTRLKVDANVNKTVPNGNGNAGGDLRLSVSSDASTPPASPTTASPTANGDAASVNRRLSNVSNAGGDEINPQVAVQIENAGEPNPPADSEPV